MFHLGGCNFRNLIRPGFFCGQFYPLWYGVCAIGIAPLANGYLLNIVSSFVAVTAGLHSRRNYLGQPGQSPALKS